MSCATNRFRFVMRVQAIVALVWALAAPAGLFGQVSGGTFTGTIADPSGAIIPGAEVSIKNVDTGVVTKTTTNAAGLYTAPNLVAGKYRVSASATGFATTTSEATLEVGATQTVNLTLQIGKATQEVQVTGAGAAVQLTSSTVRATVSREAVVSLPLNGRDWTSLATLNPGVSTVQTQQPLGVNSPRAVRGFGNSMTITGTRPSDNNYRMDGLSVSDYSNSAPGGVLGFNLGVDSVQEFSVLTSNYNAEYGRTAGGVVNAILKSGTNAFHGDAYEFMRNDNVDARNFFEPTIGHFVQNQFGGSAGGPIKKNKAFIFGDYEGVRQTHATPSLNIVPTDAARAGNLCAGNVTVDQFSLSGTTPVADFLKLFPRVNQGIPPGPGQPGCSDTGTNLFQPSAKATENYITARTDVQLSPKDSLRGSWFWDKGFISSPDADNLWVFGSKTFRQMFNFEETHTFGPTFINTFRLGYSRVVGTTGNPISGINPAATDTSLSSFAGQKQFAPGIGIAGTSGITGGLGSLANFNFFFNSYQAYDDAFLSKGAHSIKFGFAFEAMQLNQVENLQPTGLWTFNPCIPLPPPAPPPFNCGPNNVFAGNALFDFLTNYEGNGETFLGTLPGSGFPTGMRAYLWGGYIQDDWHVRPNLTVNAGLRYEMLTNPSAVHGHTVNLDTLNAAFPCIGGAPFTANPMPASPCIQNHFFLTNPTKKNFEPRVGFSWSPFKDQKTAVRGAFGIFDVLPLLGDFEQMTPLAGPYSKIGTAGPFPGGIAMTTGPNANAGFFNTPAGALAQNAGNPSLFTMYVEPNPHRNYVMVWNLNIQRQLGANTSVMVGYVGDHEVHALNREDDMNSVIPIQDPTLGLLFPISPAGTRINPNWGDIRGVFWGGDSIYHAFEAQVTKRMAQGFSLQGSYTWGKIIDTGSSTVVGDQFINSISSLGFYCKSCRRGVADYNLAQVLTINGLWELPAPSNLPSHIGWLAKGWRLGGIASAQSGQPTSLVVPGACAWIGATDCYQFPQRLVGPGCNGNPVTGNINGNATSPGSWFNLNCFADPTPVTIGATTYIPVKNVAGKNSITGPSFFNMDFSVVKDTSLKMISETARLEFRAEFFNVLNHPSFQVPTYESPNTSAFFFPAGTPGSTTGVIDQQVNNPRQIQFALKFIW